MIRVMLLGTPHARWREIAPRLRGGSLVDGGEELSPQACDAALVFALPERGSSSLGRFLESGKHVLIPIDIGLPPSELQALADQAQNCKARFAMVNPDRYLPSRHLIRQQLDAGKLGEPSLLRIHRWQAGLTALSQLRDLDLVLWYFGKIPNLIYASSDTVSGSVQIHLGFPGGGMAMIDHVCLPASASSYCSLSVIGSTGAAHADDHHNMQLAFNRGVSQAVQTDEGFLHLAALAQEFIDMIHTGRAPSPGLDHWRLLWTVAEAVEKALSGRQAIALDG